MELMHIPLSELAVAKVNVRHGSKKADYHDLIPSIRERGIRISLILLLALARTISCSSRVRQAASNRHWSNREQQDNQLLSLAVLRWGCRVRQVGV